MYYVMKAENIYFKLYFTWTRQTIDSIFQDTRMFVE